MSTEVSIKNFQSLKNVNFTIDGFTVIVGRNNIGKSAIIRALDAALTNEAGNDYIKKGEKETSVRIKRKEIDIEWTKGDTASYKVGIDGGKLEPYTKLNRAVPEPIIKAGFGQIQIEDKWVSPLIAHQFEPLFLLNKRGSVITEVLTALYDMDLISTADDLCQKDLKSQKSNLKTREKDLIDLQEKLKKFEGFNDIKTAMAEITTLEQQCIALQTEINTLTQYEEEIATLEKDIELLKGLKTVTLPDPGDIEILKTEIQWLAERELEIRAYSENFKKLKEANTATVPSADDIDKIMRSVEELQNWDDEITRITYTIGRQQKILDAIDLPSLNDLSTTAETQLQELNDVKRIEEEFMVVARTTKASREELKKVSDELDEKLEQKSKIKVCPACERPL